MIEKRRKRIRRKKEPIDTYEELSVQSAQSEESEQHPAQDNIQNWRKSLSQITDETRTITDNNRPFIDVTSKLFGRHQTTIPLIVALEELENVGNLYKLRSQNTREIQNIVADCIAKRAGIFSIRKLIYRTVGLGLAGLATTQLLPTERNLDASAFQSFLYTWNLLFSNLIFISSTLIARALLARADRITANVESLINNYKDLEIYLRECCQNELVSIQGNEHYFMKEDLQRINYIVANTWRIFCENTNNDFSVLNKYRIAEASSNMIRSLVSYLLFAKGRTEVFSDNFINDISKEFSSILIENYNKLNKLKKYMSFHRKWHLSFFEMPSFLEFASKISKTLSRLNRVDNPNINQELKNDEFVANFSATSQLHKFFSNLPAFHENLRMLTNIGQSIQKRSGTKCHWFFTTALGSTSALLGGLPYFGQMYDKPEVYGVAFYIVAPIAFLLVCLCEKLLSNIAESENKFKKAYSEYEQNLTKLVDENIINVRQFDSEKLTDHSLKPIHKFKRCMRIIDDVLTRVNIELYSEKERALITVKLFNAFGDFLLKKQQLKSDNDIVVLTNCLANYIESKTSYNILSSLYRVSPARRHLRTELDSSELLSIILNSNKKLESPTNVYRATQGRNFHRDFTISV
jgi:hypothetical protein